MYTVHFELTEVPPREYWDRGTSFNEAEFALGHPTCPMQSSLCNGAHSKILGGGSSVACCVLILGPTHQYFHQYITLNKSDPKNPI